MTMNVWLVTFCERLGIDIPSKEEIEVLLSLAGSAAHASERTSAPIACWLVGHSGVVPNQALDVALSIEESAQRSD